jgi:trehalose 6-phosphate synthase/phosphatase
VTRTSPDPAPDAAPDPGGAVLSGPLRDALRVLVARPRLLLGCDFDGVLAPIVPDPAAARPLPASSQALRALAGMSGVTVALVSGRPLDQLGALADAPAGAVLIGSHGAEWPSTAGGPGDLDDAGRALLERVGAQLHRIAGPHPGVSVEQKPTAAVLHTRRADRPAAAAATRAVLDGPAGWPGVYVTLGKEVVELAVTETSKGTALRRLRKDCDLPSGGVLFVGDDVTDEHAFAVLDDDAGDVTVKVGSGATAARHRVADPAAVARMLQVMAGLRADPSTTATEGHRWVSTTDSRRRAGGG